MEWCQALQGKVVILKGPQHKCMEDPMVGVQVVDPQACTPLKPPLLILKVVTVQLVQIQVRPLKPRPLQVGVVTTQIIQEMCQRFVEDRVVITRFNEAPMGGKVTFVPMSV